jgi:hypothetical protein
MWEIKKNDLHNYKANPNAGCMESNVVGYAIATHHISKGMPAPDARQRNKISLNPAKVLSTSYVSITVPVSFVLT